MGETETPLARASPTRVRFGVLGFVSSLSLLAYLDRVCIMRFKEEIHADLGLDDAQMGWVFAAFLIGYALFEVPAGWMGDAWGSRRVLTGIVLCWSLFTALTGCVGRFALDPGWQIGVGSLTVPIVLDSLLVLFLVRFLFGVGEAGAFPNIARVIGVWFPFRERALAQGAIWMAARLGGAMAPFVVGRLATAFSWRSAFWILGASGGVWCVAFFLWFRDSPEDKTACNAAERALIRGDHPSREKRSVDHAWPPWRPLVSSVSVWALCLASCGVSFGWYFYPTWQPEYLKQVHHLSYADSELVSGLPFLCGAVGCLAGGRLSDQLVRRTGNRRWGRSLIGCLGFGGAGLCVLGSGFATAAWQAIALLCLAFLINDLAIPVIWAACTDISGRYAGTIAGIMNMAGGIGAILSPILIPRVIQILPPTYEVALRWRMIFAGLAVSWILAALAWLFIDASQPLFPVTGVDGYEPPDGAK
jgi:ACS family glucarate transporter-like MFS transporter